MKQLLILLLTFVCATAVAQKRPVDLKVLTSGKFSARTPSGLRAMKDGVHYTTLVGGHAIVRYRLADGVAVDTLFDVKRFFPSVRLSRYELSADENLIVVPWEVEPIYRHSFRAQHFIYDRTTKKLNPLSTNGKQQAVSVAPDSRSAAFVRDNNLYVVDLVARTERAITTDGELGKVLNGITDWVYEEEYGFERAYQWSPSSSAIAFLRFDERKVKSYPMPVYGKGNYPDPVAFKYPKAGEENSVVQLRVYYPASGKQSAVDLGDDVDQYIPWIEFTGRGDELAVHRLDRRQQNYTLLLADPLTGVSQPIYAETSPRYVDRIDQSKIWFLPSENQFIVQSEVDGWRHLYLYDMNGVRLSQITKGTQEVTALNAVSPRTKTLYYTATDGPLNRAIYSVRYGKGKGAKPVRLSEEEQGSYSGVFPTGGNLYLELFSSATTPTRVAIRNTKGELVRQVASNDAVLDTMALYDLPIKTFFSFKNPEGVELNGYILKPSDFDSTKSYPLFLTQYSGPGSQSVANRWGLGWEAALVGEGYIVACVDGRGTGFRGYEFRSCTYGDLGKLELADQVATAKYLGAKPWIDADRIGIYGWSYGGFMALNAILQGADVFKLAVAVAPVTSWRFYDTIYTELYNGLPQENAKGYDDNSPLSHAAKLKGKLLIVHGTADDNVHIQNAYDMISALQDHNKAFDMIIYPDRNHGMGNRNVVARIVEYVKTNL